jgi:hypothetical protein
LAHRSQPGHADLNSGSLKRPSDIRAAGIAILRQPSPAAPEIIIAEVKGSGTAAWYQVVNPKSLPLMAVLKARQWWWMSPLLKTPASRGEIVVWLAMMSKMEKPFVVTSVSDVDRMIRSRQELLPHVFATCRWTCTAEPISHFGIDDSLVARFASDLLPDVEMRTVMGVCVLSNGVGISGN